MYQQTLFNTPVAPVKTRRQVNREEVERKQVAVYKAQADAWKDAVLTYAETVFLPVQTGRFLAEDLREAYDYHAKITGRPQTVQSKAFAGIMKALRKRGLIVACEPMRREINGVFAVSYRRI